MSIENKIAYVQNRLLDIQWKKKDLLAQEIKYTSMLKEFTEKQKSINGKISEPHNINNPNGEDDDIDEQKYDYGDDYEDDDEQIYTSEDRYSECSEDSSDEQNLENITEHVTLENGSIIDKNIFDERRKLIVCSKCNCPVFCCHICNEIDTSMYCDKYIILCDKESCKLRAGYVKFNDNYIDRSDKFGCCVCSNDSESDD